MSSFQYSKSSTVEEAVNSFKESDEGLFLAGGMTLLPSIKLGLLSPSELVDLANIPDLAEIKTNKESVTIGALARHVDVANSTKIPSYLAKLAKGIGDPQVRNRGTIGGSIANNDPSADYPAACLALNAEITTNQRSIDSENFFSGLFETVLEPGEIITSIRFPAVKKAAYEKFPNPASRYALVGAFVALTSDGVRVAVTGCSQTGVYRDSDLENILSKSFKAEALDGQTVRSDNFLSDVHAAADYRAHLVVEMTKRAVVACG